MPVLFLYGSAILIRDKETVKSEKVLTGTFYVQIISSAAFHSLIHAEPVPISAGSELITKSGGHVSAFIVHPLANFFGLEFTVNGWADTVCLLGRHGRDWILCPFISLGCPF